MKVKTKELSREQIMTFLSMNRDLLRNLHVKRIGLFGSYVKATQDSKSDVDFLVEFQKPSFDDFMELAFFLEARLGRKVDLITNGNLSPYIKPYVDKEVKWYETR